MESTESSGKTPPDTNRKISWDKLDKSLEGIKESFTASLELYQDRMSYSVEKFLMKVFFGFWLSGFFLGLILIGYFLCLKNLLIGLAQSLAISEWKINAIGGALSVLLILTGFYAAMKIQRSKSFSRRKSKFKKQIESLYRFKSILKTEPPSSIRFEKELIDWQIQATQQQLFQLTHQAYEDFKDLLDIRLWTKQYPWSSTMVAMTVGFLITNPFSFSSENAKTQSKEEEGPSFKESNSSWLSLLVANGINVLQEMIPHLILKSQSP